MPTYNFTSDLRISELHDRIVNASQLIATGKLPEQDKSMQNNGNTLAFYFNLQPGSNTIELAQVGRVTEVVRNMVSKFQFPNPYTSELMELNLAENTFVAPLREIVKILVYMCILYGESHSFLYYDEIRYFVFGHPEKFHKIGATEYKNIINTILDNRANEYDYTNELNNLLSWPQYDRQSREMVKIIAYASKAFKVENGKIAFALPNPIEDSYVDTLQFISLVLSCNEYWLPSNPANYSDAKNTYVKYMDIPGCISSVNQIYKPRIFEPENTEPLQVIYFGAPGTGKSFAINDACAKYEHYRTTFHPDSDYASFVGSYKPITRQTPLYGVQGQPIKDSEGKDIMEDRIVYRYVFQAFLKAYIAAWEEQQNENPQPVFLIVEEINRGNCAQIFGDIFQLLDRNSEGFSDYPIEADEDLAKELKRVFKDLTIADKERINALYKGGKDVVAEVLGGEQLLLPNNLYIWATMNTSDQSLFPIDSAFKRRWDWKYIKIKDSRENYIIRFSNGHSYDWWEFVSEINKRIEGGDIQQEDKKLGYFFAKAKEGIISAETLVSKVLFYLYSDVFKDFGFEEDFFKDENGEVMTFSSYFDGVGDINEARVERFITNLGLKPIDTEETEEAEDADDVVDDTEE